MTALPGRMEPDSNQQEGPSGFAEVQTSDSNHYSFTVVRTTRLEVDQKPWVMEMSFPSGDIREGHGQDGQDGQVVEVIPKQVEEFQCIMKKSWPDSRLLPENSSRN